MYHFAGHWENKDFKKRQENHHDSLNQITRAFWLVQWLFFARIWLERTISCQLSFKDYSIHGSLFVRVKIQFTWVQMFNSQFGIIGWTEFLWLESTWSLNLCQSYLHFHWLLQSTSLLKLRRLRIYQIVVFCVFSHENGSAISLQTM